MFSKNTGIKIIKNTYSKNSDAPQFSIQYSNSRTDEVTRNNIHKIISALKSDCDMIIEISSSMLIVSPTERESFAMNFLDAVKDMNLDYLYRKLPASGGQSILAQFFGKKGPEYSHEILARVPDEVWNSERFLSILSTHGTKYYIIDKVPEGRAFLEEMQNMTDDEKSSLAKMIIFDVGSYGTMGIFTKSVTEDEIKEKLGI